MTRNRRDTYPETRAGANAVVTFRDMDVMAEAIGIYSRRVTEVFALKPTAGDGFDRSNTIQKANETTIKPNETTADTSSNLLSYKLQAIVVLQYRRFRHYIA
ncbi:hypothetical protein [Shewanella violacea]|uniref:hypothetical protein n=1 Tax=Shewanella violacea TaxID=60217 RepID=UPI00059BAF0D|nr:hypothetical protein [Shewanella violacea]